MALKLKVESEQTCVPLLHEPVEGQPTEPHQLLWRDEVWMLIVIGFPVGISSFCRMLMAVTDISVLGRLENGTNFLAAASMAYVVMDITGTFPGTAADALNALCSQAHGAGNSKLIGRWLQIGIIITIVMCIPVLFTWLFTGVILSTLGCSPEISALANTFAAWSCWGLIPNTIYYSLRQYFQAQKIILPALFNNMAFIFVNLALNISLVHGFGSWSGLGFIGSPIATSISRTLQLIAFILYTCSWKKLHVKTWPSEPFWQCLSKNTFSEYMRQTFPTMIGNAAEQWQMEAVTLMAASLGNVDVATQSAVFNIFFALHCLSFGLSKATTCRVGFHLGANDALFARQAANISIIMSISLGFFIATILFFMRPFIGHLFSNDPTVWADSASLMTVISVSYVSVSILISLTAILFGQGRPSPVAIIGGVCSWLLSLPLAYIFAFKLGFGLSGLWIGLSCGYCIIVFLMGVVVYQSDWREYARQAVLRSRRSLCTES